MDKSVEFMVRVKLPSSGAYHSSPSGDTEYDNAYKEAIFAATPIGFEVGWPRRNEKWPVDSEGFTWVRLYCTDEKNALASALAQIADLKSSMSKIHLSASAIINFLT
jgi:hypothetical protein